MGRSIRVIIIAMALMSAVFMGCTNYGYMSAPVSSGTATMNPTQQAVATAYAMLTAIALGTPIVP